MSIHFIAIGGSAMHNLALALQKKGFEITGSDDEIFEPSRTRLANAGLLPEKQGWFPEKITSNTQAVILGMHARADNPELVEAKKLGVKIFSYPEYLYEQTKNKTRVVIGGSHGKTTITSMVMHVLRKNGVVFDYMVGAQLDGFDTMVSLTNEATIAVFEGDEYLTSPIDLRPKFHLYHPHIALLTGIAWDHINVFPTFDDYYEQFKIFSQLIEAKGSLVYFDGDKLLQKIASESRADIKTIGYNAPYFEIKNETTVIKTGSDQYPIEVFGLHNLQNIEGAHEVCRLLGINDRDFYTAIGSFKGAGKRLQKLSESDTSVVYLDFAHSPSKLKATIEAVRQFHGDKKIIACMELHTFSSLKKEFLPEYENCMDAADVAFVYFNPSVVEHKRLEPISKIDVASGFASDNVTVFDVSETMIQRLMNMTLDNSVVLLMSSGNFHGVDMQQLADQLMKKA
jgi:UDP-N-acetylmuramate: L-alanyl-gamma-D-glutamyl-meso-diaminopimelate ligase